MREFIVLGHDAPTTADFSLEDLPGSAGRLDVLCRCLGSALCLSHGMRDDTKIRVVIQDTLTITVDGATVQSLSPDERAIAGLLRSAIEASETAIGHQSVESSPGISVSKLGLEPHLEAAARESTLVQLHSDGTPVGSAELAEDSSFVLSDHHDFEEFEQDLLETHADRRISLGPNALHAEHAITVAHNQLDRQA